MPDHSLTLKSLKTSPYLNNLGISRVNTRCWALIQLEVQPFPGHLLLAPDIDLCGSPHLENSNFLFIFFPPLELHERKDFARNLSPKNVKGKQVPHQEDTTPVFPMETGGRSWGTNKSLAGALCTSFHRQTWSGTFVASCQLTALIN